MTTPYLRSRFLLDALLRRAAMTGWRRHQAYILAGLALTFHLVRPSVRPTPPSGLAVIVGLLAVVVALVASGPLLAGLQPVFRLMGLLPGWSLFLAGIGALIALVHRRGRRFLQMEMSA